MRSTSIFLSVLLSYLLSGAKGCEESDDHLSSRDASPDLDTCTYIDAPLSDIFNAISGIESTSVEDDTIQGCFCTSSVRSFLESTVINGVDKRELEYAAEAFVVTSPGAKNCVYPPNSKPDCSRDDVCGFTCTNGFELGSFNMRGQRTNTCACPSSKTVCNGQCGSFPDGCPSQAATPTHFFQPYRDPSSLDRSSPSSRPSAQPSASFHANASPTSALSDEQAQRARDAGCSPSESLCGAYAPRGRRLMECVDTQTSLESCGGCMMSPPSPFEYYDDSLGKRDEPTGVDCTALDGVSDVSCSAGKCVVQACEDGWIVSPSGDHCDPVSSSVDGVSDEPSRQSFDKGIEDPDYVPSSMPFLQPPPSSSTTATYDGAPESSSADAPSAPGESPSSERNGANSDGSSAAQSGDDDHDDDHGSDSGPARTSDSGSGLGNFRGSNGDDTAADTSTRDGTGSSVSSSDSDPGTSGADALLDDDAAGPGSSDQGGASPPGVGLGFGVFAAGDHQDGKIFNSCMNGSGGGVANAIICASMDMDGNAGVNGLPSASDISNDLQALNLLDVDVADTIQSATDSVESSTDLAESTVSNLLRTGFMASLPVGEYSIEVGETEISEVPTETSVASPGLPIVSVTISYPTVVAVAEASSIAIDLQENAANIGSDLLGSDLNVPDLSESGNLALPSVTSVASLGIPSGSSAEQAVGALTGALDSLSVPAVGIPTATVTVPAVSTTIPSVTEILATETSSLAATVVENGLLEVGGNGAANLIKDASI